MHLKSNWSYLNKELLAILSFLVISTVAAIIYLTQTLGGLQDFARQGSSATGTAFVLQDLLINLQAVENAGRGYVLTGDSVFLEPYEKARASVKPDVDILRTNQTLIVSDEQVKRIETLANQKLDVMQRTIDTRNTEGFEAAQLLVQSRQGEDIMNQLRDEITDISSFGLQNIGPSQQRSEANIRRATVVAGALALLVFGTCAAVILYFKRAILHERALESTKNEFLSLASHQLRTPATNVKQYIGLMLDGYMGDLNDQQRHALTVAYKNNESEISIMNNLLDVAKLDLNRIQMHKKVTDVMNIVRHAVRGHKPRAKEARQTLRLIGPKQLMAYVDAAYIQGVVENLLDNAIKYSKADTRITIRVNREEDYLFISVKDQGVGIRKRDLGKLFNKFSRLENEFSANSQGSGLGLYWVKKIVELHGGKIEVTSREGKGSKFTVRLPVR